MVVRWTLHDPVENDTWEMDINPREGGTPQNNKTVNYQNTSAPDGSAVVYEGRDQPQILEWTGVILTEDHYDSLVEWFNKRRQVLLTDDLEREFWIYIQTFTPRRQRAVHYPWKHEYTMTAIILDVN